ncbi:MAG TPA: hypothetical protein VF937_07150 [Chloroflexota bacterium]
MPARPMTVLQQQQKRRKEPTRPAGQPIQNVLGEDIRPALEAAAQAAQVPLELVLACAMAESGLNPRAERWGTQTRAALAAISSGDHAQLQQIIDSAWADVSFGYGQRIVLYHYAGNRSASVDNVLAVRQQVFDNPDQDLMQLAAYLGPALTRARDADLSPCGGDELLGALIIYNSGSMHPPGDPWWTTWQQNVRNYTDNLVQARAIVGAS